MHKGINEPHVLLASSNIERMMRDLKNILDAKSLNKIHLEVRNNVKKLFQLGEAHYLFAVAADQSAWRQRVSRFYYGAYNCRRAVMLEFNGHFSTDSSDHKNINDLPSVLANSGIYKIKLANLREDRNLADYNHEAKPSDLVIPIPDAEQLVKEFLRDSRLYLDTRGVQV